MKLLKTTVKNILPPKLLRLLAFVSSSPTYDQDGLTTNHNCDFMKDKLFIESYNLGKNTGSYRGAEVHWRAHVACWAANIVKDLDGDFVECGVNKGGLSLTIINYIAFHNLNKTFYLLDTFCGLVEEYISDNEKQLVKSGGGYEDCFNEVKETFKSYKNVKIIKGPIPDTLSQVTTQKVCYLSIDMNCRIPEIAAAEFFWDKIVKGGIILLDDYGWSSHIEQKYAFDEFAEKKGVKILSLPTGQGLILK